MVNWGPVTYTVGPGTQTPDSRSATIWDTGQFPVGSILRFSGTSTTTFAGGRSDAVYENHWTAFAANGDVIEDLILVQSRLTTSEVSWNRNVPSGATRVLIVFYGSLYQGQTMTGTSSGTYDAGTFCQFGTHAKTGAANTIVLTTDNIAELLAARGLGWLAIAFQVLAGYVLDVTGLCGLGPPQVPAINTSLLQASFDEVLTVFKRAAWDQFCECVPGTPTPIQYPPYNPTQPTSWPTAPTFPCDPADLCSSISQMRADLNALVGTAAAVKTLVELLQRYELPFAYIRGATHSGLTGTNEFAVSRLVGVDVDVTARPTDGLVLEGNPPYVWNLGWLAIVDDSGMLEEKRLTRDSMLWLPRLMPTALRFNYALNPGVTIRVTELEAEP